MKVKVQYLGPIRVMLDKREEEVEISLKTTIQGLLKKLTSLYGKTFEREVFEEDGQNIREELVITVNGTAIGQLDGLRTNLKWGDVITLFLLFAGGG